MTYGPWKELAHSVFKGETEATRSKYDLDTSHSVSAGQVDTCPCRIADFKHARDAAFAEALVNAWRAGRLLYVDPEQEQRDMGDGWIAVKKGEHNA